MKTKEVMKLYEEYVLPTYRQVPLALAKGKGSRVWDLEGREYLDFFPGWGVSGLGHCHPAVVSAVKEQVRKMIHISNNYFNLKQARLAEEIVRNAFPARVFFSNSGAEAVEGAIKFARKFGSPDGRFGIIAMENSFHGRTLAALAATGQTKYQEGFGPLPDGFSHCPLNDFEALKARVTPQTAAVILEPIQGEGGIFVADAGYLARVRALCRERNLLLIFDEVQTGMGRTGKIFAYQHFGVEPDILVLAKSLGGGVPIGAFVVRAELVPGVMTPGTHATTFGGSPLVCAASLAVFKIIRQERLLDHAVRMGGYLREILEGLRSKYEFVKEVRGLGLMLGLELAVPGGPVVDRCRERGLLINCTHETVLRIMPALTVTKGLIDKAARILDRALAETQTAGSPEEPTGVKP